MSEISAVGTVGTNAKPVIALLPGVKFGSVSAVGELSRLSLMRASVDAAVESVRAGSPHSALLYSKARRAKAVDAALQQVRISNQLLIGDTPPALALDELSEVRVNVSQGWWGKETAGIRRDNGTILDVEAYQRLLQRHHDAEAALLAAQRSGGTLSKSLKHLNSVRAQIDEQSQTIRHAAVGEQAREIAERAMAEIAAIDPPRPFDDGAATAVKALLRPGT